jgi:hypothetical protein
MMELAKMLYQHVNRRQLRRPLLVLFSYGRIASLILPTNHLKVREVTLEGSIQLLNLIDSNSMHIRLLRYQIARYILPTAIISHTPVQHITKCLR